MTPDYYKITLKDGREIEVDDITAALSDRNSKLFTGFETHLWMAAIEYLLRAPFKKQGMQDINRCISRLEKLKDQWHD